MGPNYFPHRGALFLGGLWREAALVVVPGNCIFFGSGETGFKLLKTGYIVAIVWGSYSLKDSLKGPSTQRKTIPVLACGNSYHDVWVPGPCGTTGFVQAVSSVGAPYCRLLRHPLPYHPPSQK